MNSVETFQQTAQTFSKYFLKEYLKKEELLEAKIIMLFARKLRIALNIDQTTIQQAKIFFLNMNEKYLQQQTLPFFKISKALNFFPQLYKNKQIQQEQKSGNLPKFSTNNSLSKLQLNINQSQLSLAKKIYIVNQLKKYKNENIMSKEIQEEVINQKLSAITASEIYLSTPQCLGCSQAFYYEENLKNFNKIYQHYIALGENQIFDEDLMQKYVCSIANKKSGIIFGGVRKQNRSKIVGFYISQALKDRILYILNSIKSRIFPILDMRIDFLPVRNNIFLKYSDPSEQVNRFCLRIIIKPRQSNRFHYIKIKKKKGYQPIFQQYILKEGTPKFLESKQLYMQMLNVYYGNIKQYPHDYGQCVSNRLNFSFCPQKIINENNNSKKPHLEEKLEELEPIYKYQHSSLLVVGSEKKKKFIKKFTESLLNEKKIFDLQRPFYQVSKKCGRKIYFLSHYDKFETIKQLLNKYDKGNNIKLIPLHKCMRISQEKLSGHEFLCFADQYKQFYCQETYKSYKMEAIVSNGQVEKCVFYQFDNLNCVILGYILFECMGIRPFVLKYAPKNKTDYTSVSSE